MKPLAIYHADCTDGFGAAFAAWLKFGDEAEYLPMQYGKRIDLMPTALFHSREIYILDFSFARDEMDWLFANAKRVVWLDHHKTAFEAFGGDPSVCAQLNEFDITGDDRWSRHTVILDNNKSGALLAWEYFHPGTEVPMLIQHIDDRDRWQFKLEGSKELHAALSSYKPWSFDQWENVLDLRDATAIEQMKDEGWAILRAQDAHIKSMLKQARKCTVPYSEIPTPRPVANGLALNTPSHMSEVGHELANASGTFGLVYYLGTDNRVKCSLRSNGDYDVSAIARAFNGGGHRNAAGFETDIETLVGWLK